MGDCPTVTEVKRFSMYSKILVPIDGSAPTKLALDETIKLAQALHACIRVLHVTALEIPQATRPEFAHSLALDGGA
jgi:nucleotide-binding universal stress UspA family protein